MRKTKKIKIDDKEIEVKELRVKDFRQLINSIKNNDDAIYGDLIEIIPLVTDLSIQELEKYAPSELEAIKEAAMEVNDTLFLYLKNLGIYQALADVFKKALTESFAV